MGILDFWRHKDAGDQLDSPHVSPALVHAATDLVVKIASPRVALVRDYRERLAPAVETAIVYLRSMLDLLPPSRDATAANWVNDPYVHAFFATHEDVARTFSRSREVRAFFEQEPWQGEAFGVLAMAFEERKVLGVEMRGDAVRSDVPQTIVSFSEHAVDAVGATEADLRRELGRRTFEEFGLQALRRIGEAKAEQRALEDEVVVLKARLRLMQARATSLGLAAPADAGEAARMEARLDENERELGVLTASALEHELACLVDVLRLPQRTVAVTTRSLRLNALNVVDDGDGPALKSEIVFPVAEIAGDPPRIRALAAMRFPRADLLPEDQGIREAERYLR